MRLLLGWLCAVSVGLGMITMNIPVASAFEVKPAIMDIGLVAGSSTERTLHVKNTDAQPVHLFFTVQKFVSGGNGEPKFLDPTDVEGLPEWIRISDRDIQLSPGAEKTVILHINVPKNAEAGGAYAAIFTTEAPSTGASGAVGRRIATLILGAVDGRGAPAKIVLKTAETSFDHGQGRFYTVWENQGRSHGITTVRLAVRQVGLFGIAQQNSTHVLRLLPGERREIAFDWLNGAPFIWYQAKIFVDDRATGPVFARFVVTSLGWGMVIGIVLLLVGGIFYKIRKR